jgi:hypothetical protein
MHVPVVHSVLLRQSWNSLLEQAFLQTAVTFVTNPTLTVMQHTPPSQSAVSSQCSESLCEQVEPFAAQLPVVPARFWQQ